MISVIVLTKNEEQDLPACLASLSWSNDVHVLDSGSTDNTQSIAVSFNASFSTKSFESFGKQRNFALDNLRIANEWILFLDADEIVTEKFRDALFEAVTHADEDTAGFYCCWKMMLEGRWLKHCDNFPKWQMRVLRKNRARFTDFGHGQKESDVKGRLDYIKEPYIHYGFSKGWTQWLSRHNKYASDEAIARLYSCPPWRNVFSRHGSVRNPAIKSRVSHFSGWPLLMFVFIYFIKLGFLEGRQGFIYCANMAYYEFLIQIKMREIKQRRTAQTQTLLAEAAA